MSLARYILLSCILMTTLAPSYAICNESVICSTAKYNFDVFRYFTSLSNRQRLESLMLNEGPRLDGTNPLEPCYEFAGREGLKISDSAVVENIMNTSCSTNEITIYASVFFMRTDIGGTVLELSSSNKTFLGFSVCRISNEIYLTYRHLGRLVIETFPFQTKAGKWYNISITLTGNLAVLHVNCEEIERRLIAFPDYCHNMTNTTNLVLHTASGYSSNEICPCNSLYTGSLQSVGIVCGVNGLQEVCPDKTNGVQCPMCGQFLTLLNKYNDVKKCVKKLEGDLESCKQNRSTPNNTCPPPPRRNCLIDEITYNDGAFVKNKKGEICYCRNGNVFCTDPDDTPTVPTNQVITPSVASPSTSSPVQKEKCPTDVYHGVTVSLELGEKMYISLPESDQCVVVTCKKSFATFNDPKTIGCSTVPSNCSVTDEHQQQLTLCCSKCDPCNFATCQPHSTCKSAGQSHQCECNTGFELSPDKLSCVDRDECSLGRQQGGHNCPDEATCNNTIGSFICLCPTGSQLVYNQRVPLCQDINECTTGVAKCGPNSECVNTSPGYRCDCLDRYEKTNGICTAVCTKDCQNGGQCTAPDTCTCVPGFTGNYCEDDIDECKNDTLNDCNYPKSTCKNTKGGYFCSCKAGHQTDTSMGRRLCKDINECRAGIHNCFKDEHCENVHGRYFCTKNNADYKYSLGDCKINDINCTNIRSELIIKNGQTVLAGVDKCNECTCNNGEVTCKRRSCDCSQPTICCPDCFRKNVCHINEVVLEVGQRYIDPTNRCYQYKCVLSNSRPTLESINKTCSVVRNCPLGYKYIPKGACCPVCELPICSVNNQNQELYVKNGCKLCTCNGTQWNCTNVVTCPSIEGCPQKDVVSLPDQCCPICLSSCSS